jgi:omega-6 fatty acid desaturase (delta-12 desaturase)
VAITYLHHTHPSVPHYAEGAWTFTKGALSTIDRSFGIIGRHFFHDIVDYHVIHHLFPRIPFYKAEEATNAVRPILGRQYREVKSQSFLWSLFDTFRRCNFVSDQSTEDGKFTGVLHWVNTKDENK